IIALLAVALASAGIAFAQAPAKDAKKPDAAKEAPAKADAKKPALMDINTASEKDLATLPGIGDARAAAIVKGRPYKGKDDLVQKKILTQKVYDDIKDKVIAKQQY
ncbi:MAG TPA: helix-hairpin-helix domain-containing protein, partial [Usitatibacter sp.]